MGGCSPEIYKIILAVTLFVFVFFIKLLVGRRIGIVEMMQAIIELPVGLFSLSISLLIAVLISAKIKNDAMPYFCLILGFLVVTVLLVFSWRKCQFLYDSKKIAWVAVILFINFSVGISGLYFSGTRLINSSQLFSEVESKVESKATGSQIKTARSQIKK